MKYGKIVVIDCENDFVTGSLACKNASSAVDNIAKFLEATPNIEVYFTADSHPSDHCSFVTNGGQWPVHCEAEKEGSKIVSKLRNLSGGHAATSSNIFLKGTDKSKEEYSAYSSVCNGKVLKNLIKDSVLIAGIATEFCVIETVREFVADGIKVYLLVPCLAYVTEEGHEKALKEMEELGVILVEA